MNTLKVGMKVQILDESFEVTGTKKAKTRKIKVGMEKQIKSLDFKDTKSFAVGHGNWYDEWVVFTDNSYGGWNEGQASKYLKIIE